MSRGNRKEPIFLDDRDRVIFLRTLGQTCQRTGWIVHSYVLMRNHYHWLLETPEPNLSSGMQWFQGTYAQRFCRRHGQVGHVFQGRYKSPLIEHGSGDYFRTVSEYIHLNPARGGLLDPKSPNLSEYPWSSFIQFLKPPSARVEWLAVEKVLGSLRIAADTKEGRRQFGDYLTGRARQCVIGENESQTNQDWAKLRSGWHFGSEEFAKELIDRISPSNHGCKRSSFGGRMMRRHDEKQAENLITAGLKQIGVTFEELRTLRKGDSRKQALGWLVATRTTMNQEWIADRLSIGSRISLYKAIRRFQESSSDQDVCQLKRKIEMLTI